jgi:pyridoxal phosphate enzyme (YggS family)
VTGAGEIAERLAAVRQRIARAAERAGRRPEEIALVGVSKRKPAALITAAVRAGLRHVGENYVQEAAAKIPQVCGELEGCGSPLPRWHFVGRLQRNKARDAVRHFDMVETVDSERLGRELDRRAAAAGRSIEVLLEVNLSGEAQKGGVSRSGLPELMAAGASWPHLRITGLMAIPAPTDDPEKSRPVFAELRELARSLEGTTGGRRLRELSMGMSADFEVAIEEGATIVRVGTAIFGPRDPV